MDVLIAFVKARLDEDETQLNESLTYRGAGCARPGLHFDPPRALREVAAKRLALDLYKEFSKKSESLSGHIVSPAIAEALRAVIRADAAVWSDHPDYRPEWAPSARAGAAG